MTVCQLHKANAKTMQSKTQYKARQKTAYEVNPGRYYRHLQHRECKYLMQGMEAADKELFFKNVLWKSSEAFSRAYT